MGGEGGLARVTMLLVHAPGRPEGDLSDRLDLQVCLTSQGQIDAPAYRADPAPWPFHRLLPDGTDKVGELVALDPGWALRGTHAEDDPLWVLEGKVFRPGELVTLCRPGGEELVFRVVNVEAA